MTVLALLGSCNPAGETAAATQALLDGLESKGVKTEKVFIPEISLESCRQCEEDGWGICHSEGQCIIEDDFDLLVRKINTADTAVFATPVYYGDMSESMRVFTDRLRRCCAPTARRTQQRLNFKPAIGICLAGGGGGGSETCMVSLQKVLTTCGFETVDMVPVRRQNLAIKLKTLRLLGEWLPEYVTSGEWERIIPRPSKRK